MVVGAAWYSRGLMGLRWSRLANVNMDEVDSRSFMPLFSAVLLGFATAWALAVASWIAWSQLGGSFLLTAVVVGAIASLCFTGGRMLTHDLFEGRPPGLTMINIGHELATAIVMAALIGVWPPAA